MAAPIGLSGTDIKDAIRICVCIYQNCFNPVNNASLKYLEFKQDIERLERCLRDFETAYIQSSHAIRDTNSLFLGVEAPHVVLQREADEVVGDYRATLNECQALLCKHVKLDARRGSVLENAFWHAGPQAEVNRLRKRLQDHTAKIELYVEPVKLRLTSNIYEMTEEMLKLVQAHYGRSEVTLPPIPLTITQRFQSTLNVNAPVPISDISKIPLNQAMDALALHYRQSTIQQSDLGENQTIQQRLSLLKTHWLRDIICESEALRLTRSDHLYRSLIKRIEQRVAEQYERHTVDEDELLALDQSAFAIWPEKVIPPEPLLTEPMEREEMLACASLVSPVPNEKRELLIFRVNDRMLRTVRTRPESERFVDLWDDGLVPLYAVSDAPRSEWNIQIGYGRFAASLAYSMQDKRDIFAVQRAFTDYETLQYFEGVTTTVTYRPGSRIALRDSQQRESGGIQLWQWPLPLSDDSGSGSTTAQASPTTSLDEKGKGSIVHSKSSHSTTSRPFKDINPSIVSITQAGNGEETILSGLPPPPLLIAFTKTKSTYTIWQVDVSNLKVAESRQDLPQTVLRHVQNKPFKVRKLAVKEQDLNSWNLCAFFVPTKGAGKAANRIGLLECTYLALEFDSFNNRDGFELCLLRIMRRRLDQRREYDRARGIAQMEAERPGQRPVTEKQNWSVRRASTAPVLPPISPVTSLDVLGSLRSYR
ncbi:hypothetical protein AJ80_05837 [Polytolypa hystricis UAMH7299]|uniref:Uncharacterized protein n=1 Tax=Polytolypa hystricis (strain UAMH7299) TaxID=1447883 RepID=A0A2B7XZL2_POLH7|nr:hypothetical protein AJ80_05837 [Polytolypa hystricis UAMH7299]